MPKTLKIGSDSFEFVSTRVYDPVSVYRGKDTFMRMGPRELVRKELELHRELLSKEFPVPEIVKEGETEGRYFYIEKSVGTSLLTYAFQDDCLKKGQISMRNFSTFLNLTRRFADAQLSTVTSGRPGSDFRQGIYLPYIMTEFPELKDSIKEAFDMLNDRVSVFPTVLTHGDLNPHNFLKEGIIDFGSAFRGYAGYDVVGNIYHTYLFPKTGDYENMRSYEFTSQQFITYFKAIDEIYEKHGLPKISDYQNDFLLAKTIWSAARMIYRPKMQKWRFDLLKRLTLDYLRGKSILETMKTFPS